MAMRRWGAAGGAGVVPGQAARGREAAPVGGGAWGVAAALPGNAGLCCRACLVGWNLISSSWLPRSGWPAGGRSWVHAIDE